MDLPEAPPPKPGMLLVLSAPSGAGKTTLARRLLEANPDAVFSVSVTTRLPRGAERDGVDYRFVNSAQFAELVARGELAEWAEVHGQCYGTLRRTVEESLARGRLAIFDIDVQGGLALKARWPRQTVTVFVLPPSMAELESRLRGRLTESNDGIRARLAAARAEIARGTADYDYVLVNDTVDQALERLLAIMAYERALLAGEVDPIAAAVAESWRRGRLDPSPWICDPAP